MSFVVSSSTPSCLSLWLLLSSVDLCSLIGQNALDVVEGCRNKSWLIDWRSTGKDLLCDKETTKTEKRTTDIQISFLQLIDLICPSILKEKLKKKLRSAGLQVNWWQNTAAMGWNIKTLIKLYSKIFIEKIQKKTKQMIKEKKKAHRGASLVLNLLWWICQAAAVKCGCWKGLRWHRLDCI